MTIEVCHNYTGQPRELCEAYVKAGLRLGQVQDQDAVDRIGFSRAEDNALEAFYRTSIKEQFPDDG